MPNSVDLQPGYAFERLNPQHVVSGLTLDSLSSAERVEWLSALRRHDVATNPPGLVRSTVFQLEWWMEVFKAEPRINGQIGPLVMPGRWTRVLSPNSSTVHVLPINESVTRTKAELTTLAALSAGWDGEGAEAPDPVAVRLARRLLDHFLFSSGEWSTTLHVDGSVILEFEDEGLYSEVVINAWGEFSIWHEKDGDPPLSTLASFDEALQHLKR